MRKQNIFQKRGDHSMCKKIREVNLLSPISTLEKYWDGKIPVNVKHILNGIGIHFREYDISNLEKDLCIDDNDAILGMALSDGDDLGILYSSRVDKDAINYILAHEFAHCCLHMKPAEEFHVELKISHDLYSRPQTRAFFRRYLNYYKEIQADRFAADLLIPTKALSEFLASHSNQSIESIANHFHVSKEIVHLKTMNLKRYKVGETK